MLFKHGLFPYLVFGCDGDGKNILNIKLIVLITFKRVVRVTSPVTFPGTLFLLFLV